MHFFSPANIMRLLEIVVADKTHPDVVATAFEIARRAAKVGVRAGVCDGFIGNRILGKYLRVAQMLVEDGATPYEVDEAVVGFGYPMGPFAMSDLAGLDIGWMTRKRKAATQPKKNAIRRTGSTASASRAGSARKRDAASTSIRKVRGAASKTRKCCRSSRTCGARRASMRASSRPTRSWSATWRR